MYNKNVNNIKEDFKKIKDKELLNRTYIVRDEEKKYTLILLDYLAEIERRKLFADLGYSSLYEYCLKDLNYSEAEAALRVQASRLLNQNREIVEEKIIEGNLSLSQASAIQTFFKEEEKKHDRQFSKEEKKELISSLSGKNIRESREELNQLKTIPNNNKTINIKIDLETMKKLHELRGKLGTKKDDSELILDLVNDKLNKMEKNIKKSISKKQEKTEEIKKVNTKVDKDCCNHANLKEAANKKRSRYLNPKIRAQLLYQASGRCEFVSKITGKRCEETKNLQIDHSKPFALSGDNSERNLRVYCRVHNSRAAIKTYGNEVMDRYLN